jgi:hypothetical protein
MIITEELYSPEDPRFYDPDIQSLDSSIKLPQRPFPAAIRRNHPHTRSHYHHGSQPFFQPPYSYGDIIHFDNFHPIMFLGYNGQGTYRTPSRMGERFQVGEFLKLDENGGSDGVFQCNVPQGFMKERPLTNNENRDWSRWIVPFQELASHVFHFCLSLVRSHDKKRHVTAPEIELQNV